MSLLSLITSRASNFPINFHSREREISGIQVSFPGIPGKSILPRQFVRKSRILNYQMQLLTHKQEEATPLYS